MGKISEIMLLKQPEQSALAVEVQTDMNGMSEAIGKLSLIHISEPTRP